MTDRRLHHAPRRRRGGRLLTTALALLVLAVSGVGWIYLELGGDIDTFGADGLSDNRPAASAHGQNVLVIGSDARTDGNDELGGGDAHDIGRSDTAFLLHVYRDGRHAVAVSFPRDTLVDIPPCRLPDGTWTRPRTRVMFNSAFSTGETAKGNPACTQNTVEKLTGLRVDHTMVVDFKGFAALTEVVDGVRVCLPNDVYQKDLNPKRATRGELLFPKGEQTVAGQRALDYVRLRHGIGDGSDIGRIKRQQAFVGSLFKKVKSDGLTPTKLLPLANAATESLTVDSGLGSADKLIDFAMSLKDVDLHDTTFVTLPWRYEGARVAIVEPEADALWAALRADRPLGARPGAGATPTATASPASGAGISVAVHNGTRTRGLAARAAEMLRAAGFTVTDASTAPDQTHPRTLIAYGPGQKSQAEAVATHFTAAELTPAGSPGITVTLGRSYADTPSATTAPSTPTATVPPADTRPADEDPCANLSYG
ncbi:LCP family protein [Streptomyces sp. SKN60]|uniref:LCP family protein n=1 Tax=Streptomyces sp. SKN60 TaxID=2855506 RepID=UPI0022481344|nr:LCP family protein [Streptomyces sp. SKN60]MCX2185313.1 LCP family protein [Streptomyces sp. SKN60]